MSLDQALNELALRGGVAHRGQLPIGNRDLARALDAGVVTRPSRGVYALPAADRALVLARVVRGARSHRSAALVHGWSVVTAPPRPEIIAPRGSSGYVSAAVRSRARVRWRDLTPGETAQAVTAPVDTVIDCLCDLPEAESLPIADSALRSGTVTVEELAATLASTHRRGIRAARVVGACASPLAESVLETRLRMVAAEVPEVDLQPQVVIGGTGWRARVDLADPRLGIVAEADSFAWHGDRQALRRDCRRYNRLTCAGWRVLRFSFEAVFVEPAGVQADLRLAADVQGAACDAGLTPWRSSLAGKDAVETAA